MAAVIPPKERIENAISWCDEAEEKVQRARTQLQAILADLEDK